MATLTTGMPRRLRQTTHSCLLQEKRDFNLVSPIAIGPILTSEDLSVDIYDSAAKLAGSGQSPGSPNAGSGLGPYT